MSEMWQTENSFEVWTWYVFCGIVYLFFLLCIKYRENIQNEVLKYFCFLLSQDLQLFCKFILLESVMAEGWTCHHCLDL